jgi:hypothetical protein
MEQFNNSLVFDRRMWSVDLMGSMAYAKVRPLPPSLPPSLVSEYANDNFFPSPCFSSLTGMAF